MNRFLLSLLLLMAFEVEAQVNNAISFHAIVKNSFGEVFTRTGLSVNAKILSANNCILREEQFNGIAITDGYLNLWIGRGIVGGHDPGLTMKETMDNSHVISSGPSQPGGLVCLDGTGNVDGGVTSFNPAVSGTKRKFRLSVVIDGQNLFADFDMGTTAYALNAESLQGKSPADFIMSNSAQGVTQNNIESIFSRFTKLDAILGRFDATGVNLGANITGNAATATTATVADSIAGGLNGLLPNQTGKAGLYLRTDGTNVSWEAVAGGSGSLSSVGLNLPNIFSVSGSPLTADGSIVASLVSQNASYVLAAPNASAGVPTFRPLTVSDISNAGSAALYHVPVTGDAGITELVKGDDSRLTNARPIPDNTITTVKIQDGAVTNDKLATGISAGKISGLGGLATKDFVDLSTSDVTGTLAASRMPALTGDVVSTAGSVATVIGNNVVTSAKFRQSIARSVVGVSGNATADVTDIQGTANQVLRVDSLGTTLNFGAVNLASTSAVTGALPIANGGTGATTAALARTALSAAVSGTNGDITSLTAVTSLSSSSALSLTSASNTNINITPGGTGRVILGGNVGLGVPSPTEKLEVSGNVKATSFISTSDSRLKTSVETLRGLDTILRLRGVHFRWISDLTPELGLIAQEVEQVAPELVVTDSRGFKAVKYSNIVAPLIESTKELYGLCVDTSNKVKAQSRGIATVETQVQKLENKILKLDAENAELRSRLEALEKAIYEAR